MGCVQSQPFNAITENGTSRFKVESVDSSVDIKSGILEISTDDLILYQRNREPILWSFRCLRRYGFCQGMFLFESGRRCSTGPGLFAFKCRHADELNNTFQEKLNLSRQSQNAERRSTIGASGGAPDTRMRYSESLMRPGNGITVEPYLVPLSSNNSDGAACQNYINGHVANTSSNAAYVNNYYVPSAYVNAPMVTSSATCISKGPSQSKTAIREINYAELDLPSQSKRPLPKSLQLQNIQYIDINYNNSSSDEEEDEDEAFLPLDHADDTHLSSSNVSSKARGIRSDCYSEPGAKYIEIDFQKTAALSNTAKIALTDSSSQEGVRKTRHDSSAEQLES